MKNFKIVWLSFFVMTVFSSGAQTQIWGTINIDQVWTKENSPYQILGETTIEQSSLTIHAGVRVEFKGGGILVDQDLLILGEKEDSVHFIADGNISHVGIIGNVNVSYLSVVNAGWGGALSANSSDSVIVRNSYFSSASQGFNAIDVKHFRLDSCNFYSLGYPIQISNSSDAIINDCIFIDCGNSISAGENTIVDRCDFLGKIEGPFSVGVTGTPKIVRDCRFIGNLEGARVSGGAFINNVFEENKVAFKIEGFKENYGDIKSNSFCDNIEYDIYNDSFFDFTLDSNCFCGRLESEVNVFDFNDDPNKGKVDLGFIKADCKTYTCLPTDILEDLVLTKKDGPYKICEESFLYAGVTMTIEAGAELHLGNRLNVRGNLIAEGNVNDSILLSPVENYPGYDAILVEGIGKVSLEYIKTIGHSANYIKLNSAGEHLIKNSNFGAHMQVISLNSGRLNLCSSQFDGGWGGVSLSTDSNVVSNCTFKNQKTAIVSRGVNIIKNCLVSGMERYGVQLSKNTVFSHNEIEDCILGGIALTGDAKVFNNYIHDNPIGIQFGYPDVSSDPVVFDSIEIFSNSFCNTKNIDFYTSEGVDLSGNCWCVEEGDIPSTITGTSTYSLINVSSSCEVGVEPLNNCSYVYSEPNRDDGGNGNNNGLSISGTVYEGQNKLVRGLAYLYDGNGEGKTPVASFNVLNGEFKFDGLEKGIYTILAGPFDESNYVPTFYAGKHLIEEAHYIDLQGTVFGIDLHLNEKLNTNKGNIRLQVLPEWFVFNPRPGDFLYPVLLLDNECGIGNVLDWGFQYGNGVNFDDLKEEIYSIMIPENGRISENHCLSVYGEHDYIRVEGECVCIGLEEEIDEIGFYPNPVSEFLTIRNTTEIDSYKIRNLYGELVLEGNINGGSSIIDVSELAAGAYFIQLDALSMHSFIKLAE